MGCLISAPAFARSIRLPKRSPVSNARSRSNPDNAKAYNYRGLALLGVGRIAEGLADCKAAFKRDPNYSRARSNYLLGLNYSPDVSGVGASVRACRLCPVVAPSRREELPEYPRPGAQAADRLCLA